MTPGEAIRNHCKECVDSIYEVKQCGGDKSKNCCDDKGVCFFFKYRLGSGRPSVKTIRKMCLACVSDSPDQVKECVATECSIYIYRLGTNPARKGKGGVGKRFVSASGNT